jgi:hypothetical protein
MPEFHMLNDPQLWSFIQHPMAALLDSLNIHLPTLVANTQCTATECIVIILKVSF